MIWKLAYSDHNDCKHMHLHTIADILGSGLPVLPAQVPGNFELDLIRNGKLEDLYYSTNTLQAQQLEFTHQWYFTTIRVTDLKQYLRFEGIDTFSDIYINGIHVQSTDNMLIPYDVHPHWMPGENEIVIHIKPTMLEARKRNIPAACNAQRYSYPALSVRKAAHSFGWDIMPRIISAGLWRDVTLCHGKVECIREVYLTTHRIDLSQRTAEMSFYIHADLDDIPATRYSVRIAGQCDNSHFRVEQALWHNTHGFQFSISDCKFWWPKNAGDPNLYHTTVTLLRDGAECDSYQLQLGIRTKELIRTPYTTPDGQGEFCFRVNGKNVFIMGTNWVPLDAFHSQDPQRLEQALALLDDIGCNMVRCWGGNVYESEDFFDYCDRKGILVWQDFAMGCAVYPQDSVMAAQLEEEAVCQIKRLRNHACLALWAGDNENDLACYNWNGFIRDPNTNPLTRQLLPHLVEMHDYTTPFLPSSPYMSETVFRGESILPENHLWGPRDYFKGDFYKNTFCHFASEIGYHGFPAVSSLKCFLQDPQVIFQKDGQPTDEYIVHAASMETSLSSPYAYRIRLAYDQVVILFGQAAEDLGDFVRQSQISQGEALKYFIEKFRIHKWKTTGIIWWNLLDGWPQISDAVVDYYFRKKLAYHYIKRSQQPCCLMFDEPEQDQLRLIAANDLNEDVSLQYCVQRVEKDGSLSSLLSGSACICANTSMPINTLTITAGEKCFYRIEWVYDGIHGQNHYFVNIRDVDYPYYLTALQLCGMDEFEE